MNVSARLKHENQLVNGWSSLIPPDEVCWRHPRHDLHEASISMHLIASPLNLCRSSLISCISLICDQPHTGLVGLGRAGALAGQARKRPVSRRRYSRA